jgi:hypothetical protein
MQLCEGPLSNTNTIDDVRFDAKLMDNGQKDEISVVVMGMDIDEDNKPIEIILWALVTPI